MFSTGFFLVWALELEEDLDEQVDADEQVRHQLQSEDVSMHC